MQATTALVTSGAGRNALGGTSITMRGAVKYCTARESAP